MLKKLFRRARAKKNAKAIACAALINAGYDIEHVAELIGTSRTEIEKIDVNKIPIDVVEVWY